MYSKTNEPLLIPCTSGEELTIISKPIYKQKVPAFHCIGGNMEFKTSEAGYPKLYETLAGLSKGANNMFWTLMQTRKPATNECILQATTQSERNKLTKAYKELNNLNLIKRTKQNHYMINPRAIVPITTYGECKHKYDSL